MIKLSYFSYKGGAGRSSLAYNTLPYIVKQLNASPKHPIILMDLDLDSAGLTFLLKKKGANTKSYSVQEALNTCVAKGLYSPDFIPLSSHPIFGRCIPVGKYFGLDNESNASVLFIPADTGKPLNKESNNNYDVGNSVKEKFKDLIDSCELYDCSAVIFDTPAGDQLTANWAIEYSDTIATCMRITYQFRYGTLDFMQRILPRYCNKKFVLVPNAVPTDDIVVDCLIVSYENIKRDIMEIFGSLDTHGNQICLDMVGKGEDFFGVNEVKRFKIQEDVLFKLSEDLLAEDEIKAIEAYKKVVKCLLGD